MSLGLQIRTVTLSVLSGICFLTACGGGDSSEPTTSMQPDAIADTSLPEATGADADSDTGVDADSDASSDLYWPSLDEWETSTPEEAGVHIDKLNQAIGFAESSNSGGLIIVYEGRIVTERYWQGWDQNTTMTLNSATKSMTSMMAGMGLDDGSFDSLDQPITDFAPQWIDTPKDAITLEHFLTMTTGLSTTPPTADEQTTNQFEALADGLTLDHTPGTYWEYNTPAYLMLFTLIEKATGETLEEYARRKLFEPLGMSSVEWVKVVVNEDVTNYRRIESNTRDMARFGLFTLRRGVWNNQQLVSEDYFNKATTPYLASKSDYGFLYWLREINTPEGTETIRANSALGLGHKIIMAIPSLNLVIVRHGDAASGGFVTQLAELIVAAFSD
ncbi:MAG: hypothetical protein CMH52_13475 [Myxococcales bacterium]|nr:hypothetical protein [Myxococcales bacterium]